MSKNKNLEKVLNQPLYWVEEINGLIFNALLNYKKENKIKSNTELAKRLGISKGRISQILNDNDINYSIEKLYEICFKINVFPKISLLNKSEQFELILNDNVFITTDANEFSNVLEKPVLDSCVVIPLYINRNNEFNYALNF